MEPSPTSHDPVRLVRDVVEGEESRAGGGSSDLRPSVKARSLLQRIADASANTTRARPASKSIRSDGSTTQPPRQSASQLSSAARETDGHFTMTSPPQREQTISPSSSASSPEAPVPSPPAAAPSDDSGEAAMAAELLATRRQLEEVQRLYRYETRAHLQQRTRQLNTALHRCRDVEDGVVAEAASLLASYEALLARHHDELPRQISAIVAAVQQQCLSYAEQLRGTRAHLEETITATVQKTLTVQTGELVGDLCRHITNSTAAELQLEQQRQRSMADFVLEQAAAFKAEYQAIVDQDLEERQRLFDVQVDRREQQWRVYLKEEHARMVAASAVAADSVSRRHTETLQVAMRDVTDLRRQLLEEYTRRHAEALATFTRFYEEVATDHAAAMMETAAYVQEVQLDYAAMIRQLHGELAKSGKACRLLEAELLCVRQKAEDEREAAVARRSAQWQAAAAAEWKESMRQLQDEHRTALQALVTSHEAELKQCRQENVNKEAALTRKHTDEITYMSKELEQRWAASEEAATVAKAEAEAITTQLLSESRRARDDVMKLRAELHQQSMKHLAAIHEAKEKQALEAAQQLQEVQAAYDALLESRQQSGMAEQPSAALRASYESALRRIAELELAVHAAKEASDAEVVQMRDDTAKLWKGRMAAAQAQLDERAKALLAHHETLRTALLDEVQQRDLQMERTQNEMEERHAGELQRVTTVERRRAVEAVETIRRRAEQSIQLIHQNAEALVQHEQRRYAELVEKLREELQVQVAAAMKGALSAANLEREKITAQQQSNQEQLQAARLQLELDGAVMQQRLFSKMQEESAAAAAAQVSRELSAWVSQCLAARQEQLQDWLLARQEEVELFSRMQEERLQLQRQHYDALLSTAGADALHRESAALAKWNQRLTECMAARGSDVEVRDAAMADRLHDLLRTELERQQALQDQVSTEDQGRWVKVEAAMVKHLQAMQQEHFAAATAAEQQYCMSIEAERTATADALSKQNQEHRAALAAMRDEKNAALQRLATEMQLHHRQEVDALQQEHDDRIGHLRAQHAAAVAEMEHLHEAARRRQQQMSDAQNQEAQEAMAAKLREVRGQYEDQLTTLQRQCESQQQQLSLNEAELPLLQQRMRAAVEEAVRQEYAQSLDRVREALDERNAAFAALQQSLHERTQAEVSRVEAAMTARYSAFTAAQQEQAAAQLQAQERAMAERQQRHDAQLRTLQLKQEEQLSKCHASMELTWRADEAETTKRFDAQVVEWQRLLNEERRLHRIALDETRRLTAERDKLRLSLAAQRQMIYRELSEEHAALLDSVRRQVQQEREELSRRSLQEEEHLFLTQLLQRSSATATAAMPSAQSSASLEEMQRPLLWQNGIDDSSAVDDDSSRAYATAASIGVREPTPQWLHRAADEEVRAAVPLITSEELDSIWRRMAQLWEVLEVGAEEQEVFREYITSLNTPAAQQAALQLEQQRLEDQLPLLETLTRRDYLLHQLEKLGAPPGTPSSSAVLHGRVKSIDDATSDTADGLHDASSLRGNYAEMYAELHQLTAHLAARIARHERRYQQVFRRAGRRVMDDVVESAGD